MPSFFQTVLFSACFIFAGNAVHAAESKHFIGSHISMSIPNGMSKSFQDEDSKIKLYRYQFESGNGYLHNQKELRVVIGDMVPVDQSKINSWQADTLGAMIAIFADAHHLSLESNAAELNQKPKTMQIGSHTFKSIVLHFGDLHAQFLSTTEGRFAYFFTLSSDMQDKAAKTEAFNSMLAAVKSVTYS